MEQKKPKCNQTGCLTPKVTGAKYRVWVYGAHYDHRTLSAAERRVKNFSHYEREAATIVEISE